SYRFQDVVNVRKASASRVGDQNNVAGDRAARVSKKLSVARPIKRKNRGRAPMRQLPRGAPIKRLNPKVTQTGLPRRVRYAAAIGQPTQTPIQCRPIADQFGLATVNGQESNPILVGRRRAKPTRDRFAVRRDVRIVSSSLSQSHRLTSVDAHAEQARRISRSIDHALTVGSESRLPIADTLRQLHWMFAVDVDAPKVFLPVAIGKKNDVATVGRNYWLFVETGMLGELFRHAAVQIRDPKILLAGDLRR